MERYRTFRAVGLVLGTALVAAVCAAFLPDNPYQRFQLLDNTIQHDSRWIYERTHFDQTPIDVAFIGPSRIQAGVDAPLLQSDLAAIGEDVSVVNFATPEEGRNLNLVFAEQLFATKHPKLIIVGVIEKPGRFGHPAFKYLAPASLLANPGYLGNLSFLSDLMYLPFRQMKLFVADFFPYLSTLTDHFDPDKYAGSNPPFESLQRLPDGRVLDRTRVVSPEVLDNARSRRLMEEHPPILPRALSDVEFGGERHYIRAIAHLAEEHGSRIAFLFVPYYHGPHILQEKALYESFGPVIDAGFLSEHPEWYSDVGHVNLTGNTALTHWLAPQIKRLLEGQALKPAS